MPWPRWADPAPARPPEELAIAPRIAREKLSMIRVSVLYPLVQGKRFDLEYYCNRHLPMVRRRLGPACRNLALERGLAGLSVLLEDDDECGDIYGTPVTITHLYFDSEEAFQAAMGPHANEILTDQSNYTDIVPTIRIEEVEE